MMIIIMIIMKNEENKNLKNHNRSLKHNWHLKQGLKYSVLLEILKASNSAGMQVKAQSIFKPLSHNMKLLGIFDVKVKADHDKGIWNGDIYESVRCIHHL